VDFQPYLLAWQRRRVAARDRDSEEATRALGIAQQLAQILVDAYGATAVILVGSLARGEFAQGSDIDLAVSGVPAELFFRAGADLERAGGGFGVDLVPLESANSYLLDAASREGVRLA
jgi:predicted nucleotidyltransferase